VGCGVHKPAVAGAPRVHDIPNNNQKKTLLLLLVVVVVIVIVIIIIEPFQNHSENT
jgi:hypothetical protein